jgi:hypothetical protein
MRIIMTVGRDRRSSRTPRRAQRVLLAFAVILGVATSNAVAADTTATKIDGNPLSVYVGPSGQCQSSYTLNGLVQGNFYNGNPFAFDAVGDCGFFLSFPGSGSGQPTALKGKTFGFDGNAAAVDFTETYTPVSQSAVTGDGSAGNPFSQTTTFEVIDTAAAKDALVTETTTYVNGAPQFTSTYNVKNLTPGKLYFRAIYAGDLYVNGNDEGTGVFLGGPPRFIGGQNTASGILGGLLEVGAPALGWSSFEELAYPTVWDRIQETVEDAKTFKEGIEANEVDNAVGVEWDQFRTGEGLAPGAEQAFAIVNRTQVPSALGVQPVTQSHTVGQTATISVTAADNAGSPYGNRPLVYSIGGANPKSGSVTTNASGVATISYVGTAAGLDTVQMFLDLNGNGSSESSEPGSAAQVIWTPAPPTPNSSYTIQSIKANSDGTITIVFVPSQDGAAAVEVTVPTGTISRKASIAKKKRCKKNQARIRGKCRPKTTVSGKVTAAGKAGVPLKITVKPSRKVKKALAKGRKVQLTAKLTYKSALGGTPTVKTYHFTVKAKKKKKKRH